ncbi:hypothetical protein A7A08_02379 [Methyloligella halotolerans]|uniref:Uncharacterized protein n=1 Tax=Methyloligella halotolerans TaxID=1177755 RepID=A0A1E2RWM9_9HYPH|nr:hypothetical protein [Methyloligella halotolerans]ODA66611.1 hypothetical protein A7A08_02379 [Methyloligella halotolerans]
MSVLMGLIFIAIFGGWICAFAGMVLAVLVVVRNIPYIREHNPELTEPGAKAPLTGFRMFAIASKPGSLGPSEEPKRVLAFRLLKLGVALLVGGMLAAVTIGIFAGAPDGGA